MADPQAIVRTAYSLIDNDGYECFSARKLAHGLGISHMTVYNYLARDELLDEVHIMGFDELNKGILSRLAGDKSGAEELCSIFRIASEELLSFAQRHPNLYRFMFQGGLGVKRQNPRVRGLFASGMERVRGFLSPERFEELRKDAHLFLVLTNGLILGYLSQRDSLREEDLRRSIVRGYELLLGCHDEGPAA